MAILTLDLGTTTGWALKSRSAEMHGVWVNKGGRFEGGGMRFLRFHGHLAEIHKGVPLSAVFYEEVRRHRGTDAAHVYGGMLATLTSWCEAEKIPYEGVPVQHIKKHMTGKGNAGKPEMIAAVQRFGYQLVTDENEADAIALLLFKLEDANAQRLVGL